MSYIYSVFLNFSYFNPIAILLALFLAYRGAKIYWWALFGLIVLLHSDPKIIWLILYLVFAAFLVLPSLRRKTFTKLILSIIKKANLLPRISETEKTVLRSGNIWVDGQLFSGNPNFDWIFSQKYPSLTAEEQSFLDNETEELCSICNDAEVYKNKDLSDETWNYLKEKKFFGMIIPKKYGGLEFSALAHSAVIQKLSSRSVPLAITAMVPNSLGPAELLLHYGTSEQQDYYLPRLAVGKEIPCFALTEPTAGSDATSIKSEGVLFKDENGEIKIRLNWNKRYITLGAVATIIGLAFQLRDPDKLLGSNSDLGITCALIPYNTPGVKLGRRHDPLSTPFVNSPVNGVNVVIGLDAIIGGKNGVGKGWKMLMECLSAGRGISLPSTSSGGAKLATRFVTAYANIRQQFGLSIAKFEGVEKVLARIIGKTYLLEGMRSFTAGAVDLGVKPAVVSAIAKYHSTEIFREVINDAMDLAGGSGIIRGPRNLLANAYFSVPISITVEGANIMTRSLIHFGQGAIMCHPYAYKEMEALEKNDIAAFDLAFFAHAGHFIRNIVRSILLALSRGHLFAPSHSGIIGKYEEKIAWASASFACLADLAMLKYGGNLKRKEKLNGRFGDILSAMYMACAVLRRFDFEGRKKEDEVAVEYVMKDLFAKMQIAFDGLMQNLFENTISKLLFLPIILFSRINILATPADDELEHILVKQALKSGEFRDNLTKGIYIPKDKNQALGRLENALLLFGKSSEALAKIKQAIRQRILPNKDLEDLIDLAVDKKVINTSEASIIKEAEKAIYDSVQVDEYNIADYKEL